MYQPRRLSTVIDLPTHDAGPAFQARGSRMQVDLDPFLNIDLFAMTGPMFAPHPHAGFSAATYMFDDSTTRMRNRDSLGDTSLIAPGSVHWTVAGAGIVHDEVVDEVGRLGHGVQIFVRLPADAEIADPYGMHFDAAVLPTFDPAGGTSMRVVAGTAFGARSPIEEATGAHVYDITLAAGARLEVPVDPRHRGFAMTVQGTGRITTESDTGMLSRVGLAVFETGEGPVVLESGPQGGQFLFGAGKPLFTPAYTYGGFCLSTRERVSEAVERYHSGEMHGLLTAP